MIRRSPCEYYIKYLLVHPEDYSDDDIKRVLREHELDYPGGEYLNRLRKGLKVPKPFYPYNDDHSASWTFLMRERIHQMFHPDERMLNSLKILHAPRAKEAVESMMLVGDPFYLIAHRLLAFGVRVTPDDLKCYEHFFWNIKLVNSSEMRALLTVRIADMQLEGEGPENVIRAEAMKRANYTDPRWIAANSPVPEIASMFNQMRFGFMPNRIDLSRLVEAASKSAVARVIQELSTLSPQAASSSRDFTQVAVNMYNMMAQIGSPDEELRKQLVTLGLETDLIDSVATVEKLTDGKYTSEMQVVVAERNEEDEREDSSQSSGG